MAVGMLQIIEYPAVGPWRAARTAEPTWSDVESAVRQMDGDRFPHVELFIGSEPAKDDVPDFELLGGRVGYVVTARTDGGEFYYRDASGASDDVAVWVSDQGFSCPQLMVCPDLERVIAATHYFYDSRQLLAGFPWSPDFG